MMRTSDDVLTLGFEFLLLTFGIVILVLGIFSCCWGFLPSNDPNEDQIIEQDLDWDNQIN